VLAAFYAATAFLKHSKKHDAAVTGPFCSEVRKLIFSILDEDQKAIAQFHSDKAFMAQFDQKLQGTPQGKMKVADEKNILKEYSKEFTKEKVEKIAMDLVDFFKLFDDWHCGLN